MSGYAIYNHGFSMTNKLFSRLLCQRAIISQPEKYWDDTSDYFQISHWPSTLIVTLVPAKTSTIYSIRDKVPPSI